MLHVFDVPQKFKVMSLIIETIKRTAAIRRGAVDMHLKIKN